MRDAYRLSKDLTLGKKYRFEFEAKYTGGSAGVKMRLAPGTGGTSVYSDQFTTSMEKYSMEFVATGDNQTIFVALYGLASSNVVTIDNYFLYEMGEVAAWTPKSLETKWNDTSGNNLHGTITAAKRVGNNDSYGVKKIQGNTAGDGILIDNTNHDRRIDFAENGVTTGRLRFHQSSSTHTSAFSIYTSSGSGNGLLAYMPFQVDHSGAVKASSADSTNLKQVARVHSETETFNGSDVWRKIDHNLGTKNITVSVREVTTGEHVECAVKTFIYNGSAWVDSADSCTITFATAPANNKQYAITVIG